LRRKAVKGSDPARDQSGRPALDGLLESILYWFDAMLLMIEMKPFSASHCEGYFFPEFMSTRPFLDLNRKPHFRRPRECVTQYSSTALLFFMISGVFVAGIVSPAIF
jgi:hypothetical protein